MLIALANLLQGGHLHASVPPSLPLPQGQQNLALERAQRHASSVRLRLPGGEDLGSGVIYGEKPAGYWIVTNRHVVQNQTTLCVAGLDRRPEAALVLPPVRDPGAAALDVAFLWLPRGTGSPLMVATKSEQPILSTDLPIVVSSGYPFEMEMGRNGPYYKEMEGLLMPLLKNSLEGGYDLTFMASIGKGMSGGGIFVGTRLIGINGVHADPLWRSTWRQVDGKLVDPVLNHKLELVSMGISVGTVDGLWRQTSQPSSQQIQFLGKQSCEQPLDEAPIRNQPASPRGKT